MSHYLSIDIEALADGDNLLCNLRTHIDFHTMTHVEYLIHFLPVGSRAVVDGLEERWNREHVVLHNLAVLVYEM